LLPDRTGSWIYQPVTDARRGLNTFMGIDKLNVAEIVPIALREHVWPVSRMISVAIKLLRKRCPGIELIVAFADTGESHHGGIYQAANFTYAGMSAPGRLFRHKATGRLLHNRAVSATGYRSHFGTVRKVGAGHQRRMSTELAQLKSVAEQVTLEMKPNELNQLGIFGGPQETRSPGTC